MSISTHFQSIDQLLKELGITKAQYFGFIYKIGTRNYKEKIIINSKGKKRTIQIPHPYLKKIQRKLLPLLYELYRVPVSAHGFIENRSIVSNAVIHKRHREVLNLDLENFFPSINRKRITYLLLSSRYMIPKAVAVFIGYLVTYNDTLPQGAPTSPVLSNMITSRLDTRLLSVARESRSVYTRYADDITFSTTMRSLPISIVEERVPIKISKKIIDTIESEGFKINDHKTRLNDASSRQVVTGLTTNRFPNIERKLVNKVRAMLHDWEKNGEMLANENFHKKNPDKMSIIRNYISGQISFISMVRGEGDPIVNKLWHKYKCNIDPNYVVDSHDYRRVAINHFNSIENETDMQKAGYLLEQAMTAISRIDGSSVSGTFAPINGSIQVDGTIRVDSNDYWIECKWVNKKIGAGLMQTFVGKLSAASDGTRGIYISKTEMTKDARDYLNRIHTQRRIIFIDYKELVDMINSENGFVDLVQKKMDLLTIK